LGHAIAGRISKHIQVGIADAAPGLGPKQAKVEKTAVFDLNRQRLLHDVFGESSDRDTLTVQLSLASKRWPPTGTSFDLVTMRPVHIDCTTVDHQSNYPEIRGPVFVPRLVPNIKTIHQEVQHHPAASCYLHLSLLVAGSQDNSKSIRGASNVEFRLGSACVE
jgi:hypothetical protein